MGWLPIGSNFLNINTQFSMILTTILNTQPRKSCNQPTSIIKSSPTCKFWFQMVWQPSYHFFHLCPLFATMHIRRSRISFLPKLNTLEYIPSQWMFKDLCGISALFVGYEQVRAYPVCLCSSNIWGSFMTLLLGLTVSFSLLLHRLDKYIEGDKGRSILH